MFSLEKLLTTTCSIISDLLKIIWNFVVNCSFKENLEDLYAFSYSPQSEKLTRSAGWALFDIKSEYARMGVPSDLWIATSANQNYEV